MSRDTAHLLDILEAEFLADTLAQDAVIRRLEIIGEAARRLSNEARNTLPELAWGAMIGMQNFLIHNYDDIDLKVVWNAVQTDLPPLIAILEKIIPPESDT